MKSMCLGVMGFRVSRLMSYVGLVLLWCRFGRFLKIMRLMFLMECCFEGLRLVVWYFLMLMFESFVLMWL